MKLGDTRFFNLFALIAANTNSDRTCDAWDVGNVSWRRERTSHKSAAYSFSAEVHTLEKPGRSGWVLLMAHETWWDGVKPDAFRNGKWVHLVRGDRKAVLAWFAQRERELD